MQQATKSGLLQSGLGIAGTILAGPIGGAAGNLVGGALGQTLFPELPPEPVARKNHPNLGPSATRTVPGQTLARPTTEMVVPFQTSTGADRFFQSAMPLLTSAASSFMGGNWNGILNKVTPAVAETGMYIPNNAPTHEEGGVPIEAEGGELILNAEQQAYINAAATPEEKAARYEEVQAFLMNNSPEGPQMANDGLYVVPQMGLLNQNTMEEIGLLPKSTLFSGWNPDRNVLSESYRTAAPTKVTDAPWSYMNPLPTGLERDWGRGVEDTLNQELNLNRAPFEFPQGQSFGGYGGGVKPWTFNWRNRSATGGAQDLVDGELPGGGGSQYTDPMTKAIDATNRATKLGNASDMLKMGVHLQSLLAPETQPSADFRTHPLLAPTYKSMSGTMRGNLDRNMGITNSILKDLPSELRVAGLSDAMNNYMTGERDIAAEQAKISNANAEAQAQTANANAERQYQVDAANYQKRAAENEFEHMRKQTALSGLFQAGDAAITRLGQGQTNAAFLELLKEQMAGLSPDQQSAFLEAFWSRFNG